MLRPMSQRDMIIANLDLAAAALARAANLVRAEVGRGFDGTDVSKVRGMQYDVEQYTRSVQERM